MYRKLGLAIAYTVTAYFIYVYGEAIVDWFQQSDHLLLVMGMATLMALFPIIPYPVIGAVIGAAYGPVLGGFVTWVGSTTASILMFLFIRYGYQDWGIRITQRYKSLDRVTALFERNAFITIMFSRLIPVIPSILINAYSAVSRVPFVQYAIASSLGKIPATILFASVGDQLVKKPANIVFAIGVYGVFLTITLLGYRLWKKKSEAHHG
jgi:uncharacterized membrane protein YdjX (TVP38/TMEM64 family)